MLAGGDNKHNTQHLSGQQSYSSYCYLDIQVTNSCSISRTMCHFLSFKTHWPFADAEILACLLILSGRYYLLNCSTICNPIWRGSDDHERQVKTVGCLTLVEKKSNNQKSETVVSGDKSCSSSIDSLSFFIILSFFPCDLMITVLCPDAIFVLEWANSLQKLRHREQLNQGIMCAILQLIIFLLLRFCFVSCLKILCLWESWNICKNS